MLDKSTFLWLSLSIAVWLNAVLSDTGYGSPIDLGFAFREEDFLAYPTTKISLSFIGLTGSFLLWAVLESFIEPRVKNIRGGRFTAIMVGSMLIILLVNLLRDDAARRVNQVYFDIYLAAGILALFILILGIGLLRKQNTLA